MILSVSQDLANLVTAKNEHLLSVFTCFRCTSFLTGGALELLSALASWDCDHQCLLSWHPPPPGFTCPGTPSLVLWGCVEAADTKLMTVETLLASSKSKISTTGRGRKPTVDTPCYRRASMLLVEAKVWSFMLLSCWREPEKAWRVSGLSAMPTWPEVLCLETALA